ncbi:FAD-dependent monooxygenase [Streptomyces paromomycinus]|uniref:FAD-dependent oxidoreductase n=1 Tax=Streptomyces paromomycinus TaxID=92743 RepID=A0A401W6P1_STREY|nr:FAD-dependent monooxygenase [Streptomyces paromomycinus]GCD45033.1 FAD-dependent oxidoreductase [Streptomyces paromomycinus]
MTSTTRPHALISGAGIGGPALAYWLHRYGYAVTVVERAPGLRTGGYKVDLRGVAIEVADLMGVLPDVRRASTDMRTGTYVNDDGRRVATLPADIFGARVDGDDEIMRGDLTQILYDRTRADVEYVFGDSISSLTDDGAGVDVTFERSAPRRFDLVVGADGLHSTVRRLAFGHESRYLRHIGAYIAAFSVPDDLAATGEEVYHLTPGRLVCTYSASGDSGTSGSSGAKAWLSFRSPRLDYDHRDTDGQRALLANAFASVGWQVPRLLEASRTAADFYFDGLDVIEMDRWSRGRVVLLGDAAYCASPASGQGTGMALVGAYVLAGELAAGGDPRTADPRTADPRTAFARYEAEMRPYVAANQRMAEKFVPQMLPATRAAIRFRHVMLRMLPHMPWKNYVAKKLAEDVQRGAHAITLKTYNTRRPDPNPAPAPTSA